MFGEEKKYPVLICLIKEALRSNDLVFCLLFNYEYFLLRLHSFGGISKMRLVFLFCFLKGRARAEGEHKASKGIQAI